MSDQYASRLPVFPDSPFAHMIPPGEIIDTQIGEATWLFLWCTVFGSVGSFALMGLYQHTDWWNLISHIGTRASLPHTAMFPVRKRKNPQKPELSNEQQPIERHVLCRMENVQNGGSSQRLP